MGRRPFVNKGETLIKNNKRIYTKEFFWERLNKPTNEVISRLNEPGVYLFSNSEKIIYVGRAHSLKTRIKTSAMKKVTLVEGIIYLNYYKCKSFIDAAIIELYLINMYNPEMNFKDYCEGVVNLNILDLPKISGKRILLHDMDK